MEFLLATMPADELTDDELPANGKECERCEGTGIGYSGEDMDGCYAEYACFACQGTGIANGK